MTNRTVCIQVAQCEWSWSAMTGMQWDISKTDERKKKEEKETHTN